MSAPPPRKSLNARSVELGILGSLATVSVESIVEAITEHRIDPGLFETPGASELFSAIEAAAHAGEHPHPVVLARRLTPEARKRLGGEDIIAKVCDPSTIDRLPPLPVLLEAARRRRSVARLDEVSAELWKARGLGNYEAVRDIAKQIVDLPTDEIAGEILHISEVATQVYDTAVARHRGERGPARLPTCIPPLDSKMDGGLPANLIVIGAEGGRGKSALAVRMAQMMAINSFGVGYLNLEDAASSLLERLVDDHPLATVKTRSFSIATESYHLDNLHAALGDLSRLPMWFTRHGRISSRRLMSFCDRFRQRGARVVFIDNSNEVQLEGAEDQASGARLMTDSLQLLRQWAIQWNTPVVYITHLTRDAQRKDTTPIRRGEFAHSAGFERVARVMLGVRRLESENVMVIDCCKFTESRDGWECRLKMSERAGIVTIEEPPPPPPPETKAEKAEKKAKAKQSALFEPPQEKSE